jgi:hypothetical protein
MDAQVRKANLGIAQSTIPTAKGRHPERNEVKNASQDPLRASRTTGSFI